MFLDNPKGADKFFGQTLDFAQQWGRVGADLIQILSLKFTQTRFVLVYGFYGVRSMGPVVSHKLSEPPFADLTDVTLADEDTNSILTDNANRAIQSNVAMQVTQPGRKICN